MSIKGFVLRVKSAANLPKAIVGKKNIFAFTKYPTGTTKSGYNGLVKVKRNKKSDGRVRSHEHGI